MSAKTKAIDLVKDLIAGAGVRTALGRLSKCGRPGVDAVLDALEGKHGNAPDDRHPRDAHEDLLGGLWVIGKVNPNPLIDALDRRPQHAFALVWALGGSRREAAVEKLVAYSKHNDLYVRWAAIEGLARYKKKALLPPLLAALRDRSDFVRFSALLGLAKIADHTAIEPLKRYLANKRLKAGAKRIARELLAKLDKAKR